MKYGKPEIVVLGDASHTIQDGLCTHDSSAKGTPKADSTAVGCIQGQNPSAAYDLDE
jgi:hypothetical protein